MSEKPKSIKSWWLDLRLSQKVEFSVATASAALVAYGLIAASETAFNIGKVGAVSFGILEIYRFFARHFSNPSPPEGFD